MNDKHAVFFFGPFGLLILGFVVCAVGCPLGVMFILAGIVGIFMWTSGLADTGKERLVVAEPETSIAYYRERRGLQLSDGHGRTITMIQEQHVETRTEW